MIRTFVAWVVLVLCSTVVWGQNEMMIEGKSSVKVIPEQYIFRVQIYATDTNYSHCTEKVMAQADRIAEAFRKNGVDPDLIKTQNYSISEIRERDFKTQKEIFKGYRAQMPVIIKTLAGDKKNDVIFEIIKDNFGAEFSLNFGLTPQQKEEVRERLIHLAVQDAKGKAVTIAQSAGVKLGGIRKVQYGEPRLISGYSSINMALETEQVMVRGASAKAISNVLNPPETEMRTNILITWELEN